MATAIVLEHVGRQLVRRGLVRIAPELVEGWALTGTGKGVVSIVGGRIPGMEWFDVSNNPHAALAAVGYVIASDWLARRSKEDMWWLLATLGGVDVIDPGSPAIPAVPPGWAVNPPPGATWLQCAQYWGQTPGPYYNNSCNLEWKRYGAFRHWDKAQADAYIAQHRHLPYQGYVRPDKVDPSAFWTMKFGVMTWDQPGGEYQPDYVEWQPGSPAVPEVPPTYGDVFPGWLPTIPDEWAKFLLSNGYGDIHVPWDQVGTVSPPISSVSGTKYEKWWAVANPVVPVIIRPGAPPIVVFPSIGVGSGVDLVVPINPPRGGVVAPPIVVVPPKPAVPPVVVYPPVIAPVPQVGYPSRINQVSSVRVGPLAKSGPGTHEVKGGVGQAVWAAMQIKGKVSEFEDLVEAWYKALPASLRRRLRQKKGKSLTTVDQLRALFENYDRIDLEAGVMNYVTAQIDDMVAAGMSSGEDQLLRELFPDFELRMAVRQLIRMARDGERSPAPSVNEMYSAARAWREGA